MLIEEEAQQLFTSLGFTALQAKVYLTVLNSGEATVKNIAAAAKIDRPDTYRVISGLVEQGFIEKEMGKPIRFRALPIDEVTDVLLKRKQQDIVESEKKASEILRQYQNRILKAEADEPDSCFYNLLPGRQSIIDVYSKKIIERSQETIDFVCFSIYPRIVGYEPLEDFLRRGGKDRILSYDRNDELARKVLGSHMKGSIEIRFMSKPSDPPVVALMGDKKETLIIIKRGNIPEERECLFTNNPVIAELTAHYFENIWIRSEKFVQP